MAGRWRLFDQHEQRLQDDVGEAGADGDVLEQTLNVIEDDEGQRGSVCVLKDLGDLAALGLRGSRGEARGEVQIYEKDDAGACSLIKAQLQTIQIMKGDSNILHMAYLMRDNLSHMTALSPAQRTQPWTPER